MTLLDQASAQFESGKYKAAIATLWSAEANLRGSDDADGALRMLHLVSKLHEVTKGGLRDQCEELARQADKIGYRARAIAVISECVLWGGSGLPIQRPREGTWDLIFKEDRVFVHQTIGQADGQTLSLDWWGLSVEVTVAKQKRTTTLYVGGPLAIAATAVGVAYGLGIDKYTLVSVGSPFGDLILSAGQRPVQSVRQTLRPVFDRLGATSGQSSQAS